MAPDVTARPYYIGIDLQSNILDDAGAVYFGPQDTNGTWRFIPSGNNLVVQRRESGTYVTKSTFSP